MTTFNANQIDALFKAVFSNGSIDAGLEVGADKGLPRDQYIQIPERMRKSFAVRIIQAEVAAAVTAGVLPQGANYGRASDENDDVAAMAAETGWIVVDRGDADAQHKLLRHLGTLYYRGYEIDDIVVDAPTAQDARAFYDANINHIGAAAFTPELVRFIMHTRWWSVVTGNVVVDKNAEYEEVANPTTFSAGATAFASDVVNSAENAMTAIAARGASYRKSGHATGGSRLTGFPHRFMRKMELIEDSPDRGQRDANLALSTNAFYVATHAASVHGILSSMAPNCEAHWARIDARYGIIYSIDVKPSVEIRIAPNTQVAGAALVADSVAVLKFVVQDSLSPLLASADQIPALLTAYQLLENEGVRCATYARWILDGHPTGLTPIPFDQKSQAYASLVGELATIATRYYTGSTIGKSPSLANAVEQLATDQVRQVWGSLGARKNQMTSTQVLEAVARIKGAGTLGAIQGLTSNNEDEVRAGVTAYNAAASAIHAQLANIASLGMPALPTVSADVVVANAAAAAAAAGATAATGGGN